MREPAYLSRRTAVALPLAALIWPATSALTSVPSVADPVLAQIELHKALVARVNDCPGEDDDPAFKAACAEEEAAIQALGDMTPTTVAGAAAQLAYMAEVEGTFATGGSPLLRTVLTVAQALAGGLPT